jgi:hypothetical protein
MKKNKILFWWMAIFLLLWGSKALAQEEIYISVPAHIYPGDMIEINISGQEYKRGAVLSLSY